MSGPGLGTGFGQIFLFLGFILLIFSNNILALHFELSLASHICIVVGLIILIISAGFVKDSTLISAKVCTILLFISIIIPTLILISNISINQYAFKYQLIPDLYYDIYSYSVWNLCFILSLYVVLIGYNPDYYEIPIFKFDNLSQKAPIIIFLTLGIVCYILYINRLSIILNKYITDPL